MLEVNGQKKKHCFSQDLLVDANNPKQAKQLAIARVTLDKDLKKITLNRKKDPPVITMDTIWEIGALDNTNEIETGRTFYLQKRWWCFWKKIEPVKIG